MTPVNLLMLDEPTNHLDMDACDALLAAIDNFDGAVIMVTHNEMFLHALADRLIVFDDASAPACSTAATRIFWKKAAGEMPRS